MKDSGKILLAVLAGAAAGAVLGILFAPAKGSETRERILSSAKDMAGTLKDKATNMDVISEIKEKFFDKADQITGKSSSNGSGQHI